MATDYQKIKYIDQHTQDCVYGFIRQSRKELPLDNAYFDIPSLIIYTCILYYHLDEHFTDHGPNVTLSQNDTIAMIQEGANIINEVPYDTIYGNIKLHLNEQWLYQWTFKVLKLVYEELDDEMCIGICSKGTYPFAKCLVSIGGKSQCCHYQNGGCMYPYAGIEGKKFETNDTVKMEFDTMNRSIKWTINDEEQPIYKNVKLRSSCDFYMAVSIDGDNPNGIQLLDFKMRKIDGNGKNS